MNQDTASEQSFDSEYSERLSGYSSVASGDESVLLIAKHCEHERLELLEEVYHQARGEAAAYSSSTILKEFKSPTTGNTALHIAALYGNDEMADLAVQQELDLIFSLNENDDTPLHVAARAGHFSTIKRLLDAYWIGSNNNVANLLELMKMKNKKGNIMLHEAMMSGSGSQGSMIFDVLEAYTTTGEGESISLSQSCYELALDEVNKERKSVLYVAVEAGLMEAVNRILDKCPESATPKGTSPLLVAMLNKNKEMLETIVERKDEWIHLRDPYGALALHFAAEIGYHEGVILLNEKCKTCKIDRDNNGYLPLHLAARQGHVQVVKELLQHCPELDEMLDRDLNNILHIAAESGKLDVVRYILQTPQLEKMIHQQNKHGDTPLHVATRESRASIVYALTWDDRVKINELNSRKKTPLDIAFTKYFNEGQIPSLKQSLTRIALQSAGAKAPFSALESAGGKARFSAESVGSYSVSETEQFRDRVESLSVISTLVLTASVAACLAVPGEADGTAKNLHKAMFHLFIFSITVSLFSSIGATIILIWGRFGMFELLNLSMEVAMPLLGTALITLSLAFMAGIYTVVSKLTWLATTFVIVTSTFVGIIFVLYILLFLPSSSTWKISRYISYYPFIFLASLAEKQRVPRFLSTLAGMPRPLKPTIY
ncbi:protein ACCELERATED CELL DEATH 6-like [Arachis stenosperma]|uniref:protein ACCELERATED CELL DEATH 6-like n=1 Tax=Arachis stenosperma TaxID=217475 RepID=UPI0025AC0963|nr:protein ACCELERATED CELL DEATH 6-like [Arachis stenosperma]